MCPLKIRLFGKFSVLYNDRELESFQSGKAKELFSYLLHGDRPHSREILASLLWGDCTTVQSKEYFRQTLWQLQQALHSLSPSGHIRLLQVDGDYLRLDSEADFWLDVAAKRDLQPKFYQLKCRLDPFSSILVAKRHEGRIASPIKYDGSCIDSTAVNTRLSKHFHKQLHPSLGGGRYGQLPRQQ